MFTETYRFGSFIYYRYKHAKRTPLFRDWKQDTWKKKNSSEEVRKRLKK